MRSRLFRLKTATVLLACCCLVAAVGCGGDKNGKAGGAASNQAGHESLKGLALTTFEAADLGYAKAAEWDKDAVLWYMNPTYGADPGWPHNDRSWEWSLLFVRPRDDKRYNLRIKMGKVVDAYEEKHVKRTIPIPEDCPAKRPRVTLKQAGEALSQAGVKNPANAAGYYTVESSFKKFRGRPIWGFLCSCPKLLYDVDGLTGKLLEIRDFEGKVVSVEQARKMSDCQVSGEKEKEIILAFFRAIDEGNAGKAISMMDEKAAGDDQTRKMWEQNFKSLEKIAVMKLSLEPEKKWHDRKPLIKASIYAEPKSGQYFGWDPGENQRWITVSNQGGTMKISEIATSP